MCRAICLNASIAILGLLGGAIHIVPVLAANEQNPKLSPKTGSVNQDGSVSGDIDSKIAAGYSKEGSEPGYEIRIQSLSFEPPMGQSFRTFLAGEQKATAPVISGSGADYVDFDTGPPSAMTPIASFTATPERISGSAAFPWWQIDAGDFPLKMEGNLAGGSGTGPESGGLLHWAAKTVYGDIVSVMWEAIDSPLDDNPNSGGGLRIFPGKQTPTDTTDRDTVLVRAKVYPAEADKYVEFKLIDVDDPSSSTTPIDEEPSVGPPHDNRGGLAYFLNGTESRYTGAYTDANGEATVEVRLTMQPGDNFRVAAALSTPDNLIGVYAEHPDAEGRVYLYSNEELFPPNQVTPMLTIWRRLWIEQDSMVKPSSTILDVIYDTSSTTITSNFPHNGLTTIHTDVALRFGAPRVSVNSFEGGKITFMDIPGHVPVTYTVYSHTIASITGDDIVVVGNVSANVVDAQKLILTEDDQVSVLPAYLMPGPIGMAAYGAGYILPTAVDNQYRDKVPFENNLAEVDIDTGASWRSGKDLSTASDFWVQHVVAGFEGAINDDHDADGVWVPVDGVPSAVMDGVESVIYGKTPIKWTIPTSGESTIVFMESVRDDDTGLKFTSLDHTVTHEIGHGAITDHITGGIMEAGAPRLENSFTPETLDVIRSIIRWGD